MPTSTISNVITGPSGVAASGVVVTAHLQPGSSFRSSNSSEIATEASTTTDGSGAWSLALERNSNITPAGTWWQIQEKVPGDRRVWSINVGASNATLLASLTVPLPASSYANFLTQAAGDARYQPIGAGSSNLRFFNVKDYGAVGDGVTDDTAAIHLAWVAAGSGNVVFYPSGIYFTPGLGSISAHGNLHHMGVRSNTTTSGSIIRCSANVDVITQLDGGFTFENLIFDLTGSSTAKALVLGSAGTLASGGKILNCGFFACYHGISVVHCSDTLIQGGDLEANVIAIAGVATGTYIADNLAGGSIQADQIQILGNAFFRNAQDVQFNYGVGGQINDNFFLQQDGPNYNGGAASILLNTADCQRFTVADNNADTMGGYFVNAEASPNHIITGNIIRGSKRGGIRDNGGGCIIALNSLLNGAALVAANDGIIVSSATRSLVVANYVSGGWRYCFNTSGTTEHTAAINTFINAATSSITGSCRTFGNDYADKKFTVTGGILEALAGVTTKTIAGIPTDADFVTTPSDGTAAVNSAGTQWCARINGAWKCVTLT